MRCDDIKKRLPEYMDSSLDAVTLLEVEKHLFSCPGCRKELEGLKALGAKLSSMKKVTAPDDFLQKVRGRIKDTDEFTRMMQTLFRPYNIKVPRMAMGVIATLVIGIALYKVVGMTMPLVNVTESRKDQNALVGKMDTAYRKADKMKAVTAFKQSVRAEDTGMAAAGAASADYAYDREAVDNKMATSQEYVQSAALSESAPRDSAVLARSTSGNAKSIAAASAPAPLTDLKSIVTNIVEGLGGKVISTQPAVRGQSPAGADVPAAMTIDIPSDKRVMLARSLMEIGTFEVSEEKSDKTPAGFMRLKIKPIAIR